MCFFFWENPLSMAMFNSYVCLPEGIGYFLGQTHLIEENLTVKTNNQYMPCFFLGLLRSILTDEIVRLFRIGVHTCFLGSMTMCICLIMNYVFFSQFKPCNEHPAVVSVCFGSDVMLVAAWSLVWWMIDFLEVSSLTIATECKWCKFWNVPSGHLT